MSKTKVLDRSDRALDKLPAFLLSPGRRRKNCNDQVSLSAPPLPSKIAAPLACGRPLKATQNHMYPHTHTQPAVVRVRVIRGKAKIKETTLES